jgi:hypothetical protein
MLEERGAHLQAPRPARASGGDEPLRLPARELLGLAVDQLHRIASFFRRRFVFLHLRSPRGECDGWDATMRVDRAALHLPVRSSFPAGA